MQHRTTLGTNILFRNPGSRAPILTILLSAILWLTARSEESGVEVSFQTSSKRIAPSSSITVGIGFRHHPGFHTYWKNPGVVGYPITVKWSLPPGFTAGPIQWPVPEVSDMAGNRVFGYESDVVLLVELHAPADLREESVRIDAEVSWMACSNVCRPGSSTFTSILPVCSEVSPDPESRAFFAAARERIPEPLNGWSSKIESVPDNDEIRFALTPPEGVADPGMPLVFSSDGQISSAPLPEITRLDDGRYRVTAPRHPFSPKGATTLPIVLKSDSPLDRDGRCFGTIEAAYPVPDADHGENAPTP